MDPDWKTGELPCWSLGQRDALAQLIQLAETFFENRWAQEISPSLRPRFDTLIVGPSGTGKSHLIRVLARALRVPVLRVSYGEWIVVASRENPHTLERIHSFVAQNPRGLIHIDELDKFRSFSGSDWSVSVMIELFLLLDRSLQQPLRDLKWTDELLKRLTTSFLLVGSGTWQTIWSELDRPSLGFRSGAPTDHQSIQREITKRAIIPAELLRRFRSHLIVLPAPTEADYRKAADSYGIDALATRLGARLDYSEAAQSGLGARWLEEKLADLLCRARSEGISIAPECPGVHSEDEDFDGDFDVSELL